MARERISQRVTHFAAALEMIVTRTMTSTMRMMKIKRRKSRGDSNHSSCSAHATQSQRTREIPLAAKIESR